MLWIIQEDIYAQNQHYNLFDALERLGIEYIKVKVNKNEIIPERDFDENQPIITNGSIMLSNIAKARGWKPGSLFNDNFSYKIWSQYYKELLINKDAVVSALKDATVETETIFARPILDNKTFNGKVFTKKDFLKFQTDSINLKSGLPNPETEILLSPPKSIGQEHRHYIVDGEIITSSRYKFAGVPNFHEGCDEAVLTMIKKAIEIWQPARAFVLDSYIAGDEIGIVEIGCICHAGMYHADLLKLVSFLNTMNIESNLNKQLSKKLN